MYSWVLVILLMTAKGPEPIYKKNYADEESCRMRADVLEQNLKNRKAECVAIIKLDGGAEIRAEKIHNQI